MSVKVTFKSNKTDVLRQMEANIDRALTAVGVEGVGLVVSQMQRGYGKPIRQTGNLMNSITHDRETSRSEAVGTNVEYATFVHEGTSKMAGRPYIRDGILNNQRRIEKVIVENLKQGFDK